MYDCVDSKRCDDDNECGGRNDETTQDSFNSLSSAGRSANGHVDGVAPRVRVTVKRSIGTSPPGL